MSGQAALSKDKTLSKEGQIRFSLGSLMFQRMPEGEWESHCTAWINFLWLWLCHFGSIPLRALVLLSGTSLIEWLATHWHRVKKKKKQTQIECTLGLASCFIALHGWNRRKKCRRQSTVLTRWLFSTLSCFALPSHGTAQTSGAVEVLT